MTKPSWEDIEAERRGTAEAPDPPYDAIASVAQRIGMTSDGQKLRDWLHDSVMLRKIPRGLPESALRDFVAEQRLAQRLYDLLETEIAPTREPKRPARSDRRRSTTGLR